MKQVLAACLLLLVASSQAIQSVSNQLYEPNRQYNYKYRAISLSGIPLNSNERTGLYINSDVNLHFASKDQVVIQLDKVVLRHIQMEDAEDRLPIDRVPSLDEVSASDKFQMLPSEIEENLMEYLKKPLSFVWSERSGLVSDIKVTAEEPEWVTYIKMGVLEQFQMQFNKEKNSEVEDSLLGEECIAYYSKFDLKDESKNITRQLSINKCEKPAVFRDIIGLSGERVDKHDDLVRGTLTTRVNAVPSTGRRVFIRHAVTEGRFVVRVFNGQEGEMTTLTRQELIFKEDKPATVTEKDIKNLIKKTSTLALPMHVKNTNVIASVYDEIMPEEDKLTLIVKLFKEITASLESETKPEFKPESTQKFMYITKLMRTLKKSESFETLFNAILKDQKTSEHVRPMFVNALSFCGCPSLIEVLPRLQKTLSTIELNIILTALPSTMVPTETSIRTLVQWYSSEEKHYTKKQLLLVIGSEVHQLCKKPVDGQVHKIDLCSENLKTDLISFFEKAYTELPEEKKVIALKAIGNSGLPMTRFLAKLIHSTEIKSELRVNAIYALRRTDEHEDKVKTLVPVFHNEKDMYNVEMRIAAFNILVECRRGEDMLTNLASNVNFEHDRQLGNYIYSYVNNLIEMPDVYAPTRNLTIAAHNILPSIRRFEDGVWYSKNMNQLIMSVSRRFAEKLEMNTVFSHKQALPRSASFRIVQTICGYYTNLVELGYRMEGLDTLVRDWMLNMDNTLNMVDNVFSGKFKQEVNLIKSLLKEEIVPRKIEETKGYLFVKFLGNELGVFTVEEMSEMDLKTPYTEVLTTLKDNFRYMTILPLSQGTIRVQTPMGIPMNADYNMVSIIDLTSTLLDKDALFSRSIVPRLAVIGMTRIGCDIGLFKPTIGQTVHLRTVLPLKVHVIKEDEKVSFEIYLDHESKLYKNADEEEFRPFVLESKPIRLTHAFFPKSVEFEVERKDIKMHPLLDNVEHEIEYDGWRVNVASESHSDWTMKRPSFPLCGRHSLVIRLNKQVQPFGFKVEALPTKVQDKKYKLDLSFILNPRIASSKKELALTGTIDLESSPLLSLEVAPKFYTDKVYKMYYDYKLESGRLFTPLFNWINAGEDRKDLFEIKHALQFGWDVEFNAEKQDIVIKSTLKKSDLQKMFETVDAELKWSECNKCEENAKKNEFSTVECRRCLIKRSWLSRIESQVFVAPEVEKKLEILKPLKPVLVSLTLPHLDIIESRRLTEQIRERSLTRDMTIVRENMKHVTSDDVIAVNLIHDIHPYFTEWNMTVQTNDKTIAFTRIPLIPAFRRLDNLNMSDLTDVAYDRIRALPLSHCTLDITNKLRTLDGFYYDIPKEAECERILMKDFTREDKYEITTSMTSDKKRIVTVKLAKSVIEIEETTSSDKYLIKVNKAEKPWTVSKDSKVKEIRTSEMEARLHKIEVPSKGQDLQTTIYLPAIKTTVTVVKGLVDVQAPNFFKNQVCGLCGDFNGEKIHELVLPNQTLAPSLDSFIKAYSSDKCRA